MLRKNIKIIIIPAMCLSLFNTATHAMKENKTNTIENTQNIIEIKQKTIASFKRKLKNLISPLIEKEQELSKDIYYEILSFICLNDDTTLNENKLILKLKELNLIENNNNINYFISDNTRIKLEKSLLNSKNTFAEIVLNSKLKSEKDAIKNVTEQALLLEKLKNTNELMKSLLEFNNMRNESDELLVNFLKTSPLNFESESVQKIKDCYDKMEKHNKKIRTLCEKADILINKKNKEIKK